MLSVDELIALEADSASCCFSVGSVLLLQTTRACNQACLHCMRSAALEQAGAIDLERLRGPLSLAIVRLAVERIVISGGEPTIVPNLVELMRSIVSLTALPFSLCTNALTVKPSSALQMSEAGLRKATVSLDGVGTVHDTFRRSRGAFDRSLKGINNLIAAGIAVSVNVVIHDHLLPLAAMLAEALRPIAFSHLTLTVPMLNGRAWINADAFQQVTPSSVSNFAAELTDRLKRPVGLRIPRCNKETCPSGRKVHLMTATGDLQGCPDRGAVNALDRGPTIAPRKLPLLAWSP